jgi:predicted acylesterase/phospholipase RssA
VGWIYGTSAGALVGTMAALDRLDELERFTLGLQPSETFLPNRLWQLPLSGLHRYALPRTVEERIGPAVEIAAGLRDAPIEMIVCVTDVSIVRNENGDHTFERMYASRSTPPETMATAVLASAAVSALVLPIRIGDVVATDGSWVRNFPLGHAYENSSVKEILGFRYLGGGWVPTAETVARMRRRLERFRVIPPIGALVGELERAEARQRRGEPAHLADMMGRLMRVAVARNSSVEERWAAERDGTTRALASLRHDLLELAERSDIPADVREEIRRRLDVVNLPEGHGRALPVSLIHGDAGGFGLDSSFRPGLKWPVEPKLALLARGRALAADALVRLTTAERE